MRRKKIVKSLGIAAALLAGVACSDSAGPDDTGAVIVRLSGAAGTSFVAELLTLDVPGSIGVLTIDAIHLIVDEFKLERVEDACEDLNGDDDACENFEAPPFFVAVPLDGDDIGIVSQAIPADTYEELKFETKAPEDDGSLLAEMYRQKSRVSTLQRFTLPAWLHQQETRSDSPSAQKLKLYHYLTPPLIGRKPDHA